MPGTVLCAGARACCASSPRCLPGRTDTARIAAVRGVRCWGIYAASQGAVTKAAISASWDSRALNNWFAPSLYAFKRKQSTQVSLIHSAYCIHTGFLRVNIRKCKIHRRTPKCSDDKPVSLQRKKNKECKSRKRFVQRDRQGGENRCLVRAQPSLLRSHSV